MRSRAGALYEGRDLKPTLWLDTLIAGALAQHYALDPARVAGVLFPEVKGVRSGERLVV